MHNTGHVVDVICLKQQAGTSGTSKLVGLTLPL